jgi:CBS domain-containing protein
MYEFLEETVEDNMTSPAKTVAPEMTVGDLYRLFAAHDFDAYPVIKDGLLLGVVSKFDALKVFTLSTAGMVPHYDDLMGTTVDEIMSCPAITVESETKLQRVVELMSSHRLKSLPVVDRNNRLKGIIAREDIMRALARCTGPKRPPNTAPAATYYEIA